MCNQGEQCITNYFYYCYYYYYQCQYYFTIIIVIVIEDYDLSKFGLWTSRQLNWYKKLNRTSTPHAIL